jgi:hypothetical protein
MSELRPGTYRTRDGSTAHVWEYGKNALGEDCWLGTVEGVGFGSWDSQGRDRAGSSSLDIIPEPPPASDPPPDHEAFVEARALGLAANRKRRRVSDAPQPEEAA